MKILSLQVELGECANEWRGFKFWSENLEPTKFIHTTQGATIENADFFECMNDDCKQYSYKEDFENLFEPDYDICPKCGEGATFAFRKKYPLLEEYVDCLHFILSVGLELELEDVWITQEDIEVFHSNETTLKRFKNMFRYIDKLIDKKNMHWYEAMFGCFIGLGQSLGFTWKQIEQAYLDKNKINHERQLNGY